MQLKERLPLQTDLPAQPQEELEDMLKLEDMSLDMQDPHTPLHPTDW